MTDPNSDRHYKLRNTAALCLLFLLCAIGYKAIKMFNGLATPTFGEALTGDAYIRALTVEAEPVLMLIAIALTVWLRPAAAIWVYAATMLSDVIPKWIWIAKSEMFLRTQTRYIGTSAAFWLALLVLLVLLYRRAMDTENSA